MRNMAIESIITPFSPRALMASSTITSLPHSTLRCNFSIHRNPNSPLIYRKQCRSLSINATSNFISTSSSFASQNVLIPKNLENRRGLSSVVRSYNTKNDSKDNDNPQQKKYGLGWPILRRWDVPWPWQTISLTSLACGISFVVTGLIETEALPLLGIQIGDLTMEQKAELLFLDQGITTAVVLGVLFSLTKSFQPLPDDLYRYDLKEPFNLQKGWLLWAVIGLVGALGAIALTGVALSFFSDENPQRETDALVRLLPLIGSSSVSTLCLVGITGVLAPLLEETVFRGFFMTSLTKWVPTPIAVVISASVFALAHLTPGEFPQLFVLGTALGFSYAQTRNLLTPITIHSFWNSGVILLLTFLQLQGYDIKQLLQASQ